ncbi:MAG: hypothetical protein NTW21_32090 [Verrucomicrobia bacterium]|nr:hypothetical protein [Verrucomicrobiota bacterium]
MDPTLSLTIDRTPAKFRPGERLDGRVSWQHAENIRSAAVRLFWTTSGKGTTDTAVVAAQDLEHPQADDTRTFSFVLPAGPPGFSGSLITLSWGVELVIEPGEQAVHREFEFGPQGNELRLPQIARNQPSKKTWFKPF